MRSTTGFQSGVVGFFQNFDDSTFLSVFRTETVNRIGDSDDLKIKNTSSAFLDVRVLYARFRVAALPQPRAVSSIGEFPMTNRHILGDDFSAAVRGSSSAVIGGFP